MDGQVDDGTAAAITDDVDWPFFAGGAIITIPSTSPNYTPDADLDFDGDIDGADRLIFNAHLNTPPLASNLLGAAGGSDLSHGYGGYLYEPLVGMYHTRNRWYDAELGRFLQRDPAGYMDGMNLYKYGASSPFVYLDPWGLDPSDWWLINKLTNASESMRGTVVGNFASEVGFTIAGGLENRLNSTERSARSFAADPIKHVAENNLVTKTVEGVSGSIERTSAVAHNTSGGNPGFFDYVHSGAAVFTGMQDVAEGIAGVDVQSGTMITSGWDRAGMIFQGVGQGLSLTAGGALLPARAAGVTGSTASTLGRLRQQSCPTGVPNQSGLPVLSFSRARHPDLVSNMEHAMNAGHPYILQRASREAAIENRREAIRDIPSILSRDEYPFASTKQGGAGSWVGHVPAAQNQSQGGIISQFYRQNNITAGDWFRVKIDE